MRGLGQISLENAQSEGQDGDMVSREYQGT